jgi:aldehyde:ferredoxin oxidoreductase
MIGGYTGKLLRVDLSEFKITEEKMDLSRARDLIGGVGFAAKIMLQEVNPYVKPFDPDNRLIFMTGVLTGTTVPGGNKSVFVARSPLTNIWGDAIFSGMCGIELKRAGYDGIIIQGKAEKPVYLRVFDGGAELRDAGKLWGMDTFESCNAIKSELNLKEVRVASIGPAGERLVKLACIMSDDGRAAGRCGLGAVMGSKNLKAIVIKGSGKIEIADKDKLVELRKEVLKRVNEKQPLQFGTAGSVVPFEEMGNLPIKNWTRGRFPSASRISGQTIAQTILKDRKTCFGCPVACGRYVEIKEGPYAPLEGYGPEYETIAMLGSLCMNDHLESIAKANDICNRLGIDTISVGAAIAFAMECYEKGIITRDNTGGIDLSWGNHKAIVKMCELIGRKEGFGTILGEGVKAAAEKIGKGSDRFALHVKGLEIPAHNPYRFKEMGLAYAVSNRGACHNRGSPAYVSRGILIPELGFDTKTDGFTIDGKGRLTKIHQDVCLMLDALGMCKFVVFFGGLGISILADFYTAVTGLKIEPDDLVKTGERIWLLQRVFNIRMGITRKDDTLPERFLKEPILEGPAKGQVVNLEPMLEEYYELRGLDEEGKPKEQKLKELGLDFAIPFIK